MNHPKLSQYERHEKDIWDKGAKSVIFEKNMNKNDRA